MVMKVIKAIEGGTSSVLELVSHTGSLWVHKASDTEQAANERAFNQALAKAGIPCLALADAGLPPNELLLEYVQDSRSVANELTEDNIEEWGAEVGKMHAIRSHESAALSADGNLQPVDWTGFVRKEIGRVIARQTGRPGGLAKDDLDRFERRMSSWARQAPQSYSLLHADLHSNNALIRNGEVVLFDKGPSIFYGDPLWDLATVIMEFPKAMLSEEKDWGWEAFARGYGSNPLRQPSFYFYALLRSVDRYPNQFLPEQYRLIKFLLDNKE